MDGREETSMWKKEITFRRKPKAKNEAAPATPAQTSIWKKEIAFRRKPRPADHEVLIPVASPVSRREAPPSPQTAPPVARSAEPLLPVSHELTLPPLTPPADPVTASPPAGWSVPPATTKPRPDLASEAIRVVEPTPDSPGPESHETAATVEPVSDGPVSHQPVAEFSVPPVTPPAESPGPAPAAAWAPPLAPLAVSTGEEPPPAREQEPELQPAPEAAPVAEPEAVQPPAPLPAADPRLSSRQARKAKRAAGREAKDLRKRAEETARKARKSNPAMRSRVVGLKVGASQVAAAEVVNKSGPRIVRMARMPLDRGVVVGGEVRDPDALAAALKTFFRKNKLPKAHVRLGVSNNRIGVRVFEIAGIDDEKQLANAIRFRAQETLSIPLDEAVLDHRILSEHVNNEGVRVRRVLLVVAHRELVERYVSACRKAGLRLIGIDLEAFALLRALSDPATPPAGDAGVVCITIGHDRSTLAVSDGRVCEFTRVLAWGGSALDAAVARVLDLTPSAAEPIRRELSLDEEGETAGIDARRADEARRAIAGELQVFAREITASLRFYQEQPESLGISEILVTGGAGASGGLPAELEQLIGVPVRVADPLGRVELPRKLRNRGDIAAGSLAVAVGLGIED
jgi:type IV pilus assembly protein PilM